MEIMDAFEEACAAAEVPIEVLYGGDYEDATMWEKLAAAGVQRAVIPDREELQSDVEIESGSALFRVPCEFVIVMPLKDGETVGKDLVDAMRDFLVELGFVTENGNVGVPPNTPFDFENVRFTGVEFPVGRNLQPEKFGEVWLLSQFVTIDLAEI